MAPRWSCIGTRFPARAETLRPSTPACTFRVTELVGLPTIEGRVLGWAHDIAQMLMWYKGPIRYGKHDRSAVNDRGRTTRDNFDACWQIRENPRTQALPVTIR